MKKPNKYLYGWKFYCNYGQGWEYELFEETFAGMKENRKAYRENSTYPLKITRGREVNPEWKGHVMTANHTHAIKCYPKTSDGTGYATCECGATLRIEHGVPKGGWHACERCSWAADKGQVAS